jgi:hypothetical protein
MNCETFNSLVKRYALDENTGKEFSNAHEREAFDAHASTCAECGAILAANDQLACALESMRYATRNIAAPSHLETALREKFRRHSASATPNVSSNLNETLNSSAETPAVFLNATLRTADKNGRVPATRAMRYGQGNSIAVGSPTMSKGWMVGHNSATRAATFAFAIVLAVVALVAVARYESNADLPSPQLATSSQNPLPGDTASTAINSVPARPTHGLPRVESNNQATSYLAATAATTPVSFGSRSNPKRDDAIRADDSRRRKPQMKNRATPLSSGNSSPEIVTAFLPLVEAESLAAIESGHIMRVEMPREALVSFGLPMNQERAGGLVKADVLLGDDGVARAIRFVR